MPKVRAGTAPCVVIDSHSPESWECFKGWTVECIGWGRIGLLFLMQKPVHKSELKTVIYVWIRNKKHLFCSPSCVYLLVVIEYIIPRRKEAAHLLESMH